MLTQEIQKPDFSVHIVYKMISKNFSLIVREGRESLDTEIGWSEHEKSSIKAQTRIPDTNLLFSVSFQTTAYI